MSNQITSEARLSSLFGIAISGAPFDKRYHLSASMTKAICDGVSTTWRPEFRIHHFHPWCGQWMSHPIHPTHVACTNNILSYVPTSSFFAPASKSWITFAWPVRRFIMATWQKTSCSWCFFLRFFRLPLARSTSCFQPQMRWDGHQKILKAVVEIFPLQ